MQSKLLLLVLTLSTVVVVPACKSSTRTGWWKPSSMWASKSKDSDTQASALARSAPALPSTKFDSTKDADTAIASTSKSTESGPPADLLAAAPSAKYPSQSAPAYEAPQADPLASTASGATGESIAPQQGPYSNQGYAAADTNSSNLPSLESVAPSATPLADRYAQLDRYSNQPAMPEASVAPVTPPVATEVSPAPAAGLAATPSVPATTEEMQPQGRPDRYAQYDTPTSAGSVTTTPQPTMPVVPDTSIPVSHPGASAPASLASVQLPATPGGYRPGGTSTYTPASTANVATLPATPESATGYPPSRYQDTPAPTAPSSYGAPSYR
jgi:hypothetical protein